MRLDLHVHTTASDGAWSPEAVVRAASAGGLDVLAIADHDTTSGYDAARRFGPELQIQVVPAIEVSSTHEGRDVHVLGYFIDVDAPALVRYEERARNRREDRMREMLDRLSGAGIDVAYHAVEEAAGPDRVAIGRPHLAQALVTAGHARSVPEAFDTLIGDRAPAFVPTHLLTPGEAVDLIVEAGGMPVWAHPPSDLIDPLLRPLVDRGLVGLEVYRPRSRRDRVLRLEQICRTTGLVATGGSDWHGPDSGTALGDFHVTAEETAAFLDRAGM